MNKTRERYTKDSRCLKVFPPKIFALKMR